MNRSAKRKADSRKYKPMTVSTAVLLLVLLFCFYSVLLMCERSCIYSLDDEIRQLESEYELAVKKNDDLQTELLKSGNLNEIEQYATNVLGMIKPQSSYISYVSYGANYSDDVVSADNSFIAWISSLFD